MRLRRCSRCRFRVDNIGMARINILTKSRKKRHVFTKRALATLRSCFYCRRLLRKSKFNAVITAKGKLSEGLPHDLTCPHSVKTEWLPEAYRQRLRDEDAIEAWRLSCFIESNDFFSSNLYDNPKTTWKHVRLINTPPPIAMGIARKLVETGGPFWGRNPRDMFYCILGIAMLERILTWVLIKDKIYAQIYEHLYSTLPDEEPSPVFVRGFQIEPFSIMPNDLRDWQLTDFRVLRDDEDGHFI